MAEAGHGGIDSSRCPSTIEASSRSASAVPAAITEEGSPVDRRIAEVVEKHAEMMHHLLESEALESLESIAAQQRSRAAALRKESAVRLGSCSWVQQRAASHTALCSPLPSVPHALQEQKDEESPKYVQGTFILNSPEDIEGWSKSPRVKLLIIARQKKVGTRMRERERERERER
jgi:hypothetical protein